MLLLLLGSKRESMNNQTLTIRMEGSLYQGLKDKTQQDNLNMSKAIKVLVRAYLDGKIDIDSLEQNSTLDEDKVREIISEYLEGVSCCVINF